MKMFMNYSMKYVFLIVCECSANFLVKLSLCMCGVYLCTDCTIRVICDVNACIFHWICIKHKTTLSHLNTTQVTII